MRIPSYLRLEQSLAGSEEESAVLIDEANVQQHDLLVDGQVDLCGKKRGVGGVEGEFGVRFLFVCLCVWRENRVGEKMNRSEGLSPNFCINWDPFYPFRAGQTSQMV